MKLEQLMIDSAVIAASIVQESLTGALERVYEPTVTIRDYADEYRVRIMTECEKIVGLPIAGAAVGLVALDLATRQRIQDIMTAQ